MLGAQHSVWHEMAGEITRIEALQMTITEAQHDTIHGQFPCLQENLPKKLNHTRQITKMSKVEGTVYRAIQYRRSECTADQYPLHAVTCKKWKAGTP